MKRFVLSHQIARQNALKEVSTAPDGYIVIVKEPTRNLDQNAKFHALCGDLAKNKTEWGGKERTEEEWKQLLVSGHAVATKQEYDTILGLEGEVINLRESTAKMSKSRSSSLIEYTTVLCANLGIL